MYLFVKKVPIYQSTYTYVTVKVSRCLGHSHAKKRYKQLMYSIKKNMKFQQSMAGSSGTLRLVVDHFSIE